MNGRQLLRDVRNYVPAALLNFLDLSQLPGCIAVPEELRTKLPGMLKTGDGGKSAVTTFIVCEPVPEYPGMPVELAEEIRTKRRFLTFSPETDMPGLVAEGEQFVRVNDELQPAVAFSALKYNDNTWSMQDAIADFFSHCLWPHRVKLGYGENWEGLHHSQVRFSGLKDTIALTVQTGCVVGVTMAAVKEHVLPVLMSNVWDDFWAGYEVLCQEGPSDAEHAGGADPRRERFRNGNKDGRPRGWCLKDFRPTDKLIGMGDHALNGFVIRVRVADKTQEQLEQYMRPRAMLFDINGHHIPDCFHLQRPGPGGQMHLIGETGVAGVYVPSPEMAVQAELEKSLSAAPNVTVASGHFGEMPADALVAFVSHDGDCQSWVVDAVIRQAAGELFHLQLADQLQLAQQLVPLDEQSPPAKRLASWWNSNGRAYVAGAQGNTVHGEFGNVIFVLNEGSLEQRIGNALAAAQAAGFKSVVLPAVGMHEQGGVERIRKGVEAYVQSAPADREQRLGIIVAGFYEPEPLASNVEKMLHRFCCEPSPRDSVQVRALKEQIRRKWLKYDRVQREGRHYWVHEAEQLLRNFYRRRGYNLSLEYEVMRRFADIDRFNGCPEAVLYDLRSRMSLCHGALQGGVNNWMQLHLIQSGLSTPGDGRRIPLAMCCEESKSLLREHELGHIVLRMIESLEAAAAPAEEYLSEFIATYWKPIDDERRRIENELRSISPDAYLAACGRLNEKKFRELVRKNSRAKKLLDQHRSLERRDSDSGLSFQLVCRLFDRFAPALPGMTTRRPRQSAISAAFQKYLFLTPRDRKTGAVRSRPPKRNVFAKVEGFWYKCEDGWVTFRFALPRGSYATMLINLFFDTGDKRLEELGWGASDGAHGGRANGPRSGRWRSDAGRRSDSND